MLNAADRTVDLRLPGMLLDLGGIAKGYACDQALLALLTHGVDQAMVEAGGDVAMSGPPPGKPGWTIGILGCDTGGLCLANCGISTSGDAEQCLEVEGRRYSHVVDPRTGMGLTHRLQATVIASTALLSDSLTKVCSVLDLCEAAPILQRYCARQTLTSKPCGTTAEPGSP
jgi:thiamine biosynthesis lipoprotein